MKDLLFVQFYGHIFVKSFLASFTRTRLLIPLDKIERVLMIIYPSKISFILDVGMLPNYALRMSSKIALYA